MQFKQALGMRAGADKEWRPTSNARNNDMVREAKKFAQHLKRLHKDVSGWTKTMDGESAVRRNTGTVTAALHGGGRRILVDRNLELGW